MRIALDISPLSTGHRVRGTGSYTRELKQALERYFPSNVYTFFTNPEEITKKVDIIHYPYFNPFSWEIPLQNKYPTIITIHDLIPLVFPTHFPAGIRGKVTWEVQKRLLYRMKRIIVDSLCSKKDVQRLTGISEDRIDIVYLAAGEKFKKLTMTKTNIAALKHKYHLPDAFALYVGDVTWNKNLPRLIDAITKINIPLVMIGKAIGEESFDRTNAWNLDRVKIQEKIKENKQIYVLGFVEDEDLVQLYNIAKVFVFPSLYEGFGLPILEAMQCGVPVVTSNKGSLKEVGGDAVEYVDAYSEDAIAQGIHNVWNDVSLQMQLSKKGQMQAKKFSWKQTATLTLQAYEKATL